MLILASGSPRRKDILRELGVDFKVICADTDETSALTDPRLLTEELASRKGLAVYRLLAERDAQEGANSVIISADTVVYCDGKILGKPQDEEDALRMLTMLSGSTHSVITGVAVTVGGVCKSASELTEVTVADVPKEELLRYAKSGEPLDKAGAYAIQGRFSPWISGINGCYFNVVGLPVHRLNSLYFECTGKYLV